MFAAVLQLGACARAAWAVERSRRLGAVSLGRTPVTICLHRPDPVSWVRASLDALLVPAWAGMLQEHKTARV